MSDAVQVTHDGGKGVPELFGGTLLALREGAGLTQERLGALLFVARSTIAGFESGEHLPNIGVVKQYEGQFNVQPDALVTAREQVRAHRRAVARGDQSPGDVAPGDDRAADGDLDHQPVPVGDDPAAVFGGRLHALRLSRKGLSQRRLATALEQKAHGGIIDYEKGRRLPPLDVVERYEDYFGLGRGELVIALQRARSHAADRPLDGILPGQIPDVPPPYPGLPAFGYEDRALFFGREDKIEAVREMVLQTRLVAVVGASGVGKSSFVLAGLLPSILEAAPAGSPPRHAHLTPGRHPLESLATAVNHMAGRAVVDASDLRDSPASLARAVEHTCSGEIVLIVDQLEELFTMCSDEAERSCFFEQLLVSWRHPSQAVTLIVTLRADFYGYITGYPDPSLTEIFKVHQVALGPMSDDELRRAIELPVGRCDLFVQSGLTDTILHDLAGEPGGLPLLSQALRETFRLRHRFMLTTEGYQASGGVRGAIAKRADATFDALDTRDQGLARSVFLRLSNLDDGALPTRRQVDRRDLPGDPEALDRVLGTLAGARLITLGKDDDDNTTVDVSHEALIRHWPKLRAWLREHREDLLVNRRLSDAARDWGAGDRQVGLLYRDPRLANARDWATRHPAELNDLERHFLERSEALAQAELAAARQREAEAVRSQTEAERSRAKALRSARRLRASVLMIAVVALVAGQQRFAAINERDIARAERLATDALGEMGSDPSQALSSSLRAYSARRTPLTESVLRLAASSATPQLVLRAGTPKVNAVAFAPDGQHLAAGDEAGTVRVWDQGERRASATVLRGHTESVGVLVFEPLPDGRLATGSRDGTVRVWDWRRPGNPPTVLNGHREGVAAVTFAGEGIVTIDGSGTVRTWDLRAPSTELLAVPLGEDGDGVSAAAAFAGDGPQVKLASIGSSEVVEVLDSASESSLRLSGDPGLFPTLALSPDGTHLASGSGFRGSVKVWDLRSPSDPPGELQGSQTGVFAVALSGGYVASAGRSGTVLVWDLGDPGAEPAVLRGHGGQTWAVAFSGDGRYVVSGGTDGTVRVWDWRAALANADVLRGGDDAVFSVAVQGGRIASGEGTGDGTVKVWNAAALEDEPMVLGGPTEETIYQVALGGKGRYVASAESGSLARVWDLDRPGAAPVVLRHLDPVLGVAFVGDGRLATRDALGQVRLWRWPTPSARPVDLRGDGGSGGILAVSPEGRFLAAGTDDDDEGDTVRVWDLRSPRSPPAVLRGNRAVGTALAFSGDGRYLAGGSDGPEPSGPVRVVEWRAEGSEVVELRGHEGGIRGVTFAPDGRHLASAGSDGTVRIWDLRALRTAPTVLRGHQEGVFDVAFAADGHHLISGGDDGTVRVWDCQRCGPMDGILKLARERTPRTGS